MANFTTSHTAQIVIPYQIDTTSDILTLSITTTPVLGNAGNDGPQVPGRVLYGLTLMPQDAVTGVVS